MAVAEVERVVQERLPVRADVQHDGDGSSGVDAAGSRVEGELAEGDADTSDTPVADAEDCFAVGGDDQVDVVRAEPGRLERISMSSG